MDQWGKVARKVGRKATAMAWPALAFVTHVSCKGALGTGSGWAKGGAGEAMAPPWPDVAERLDSLQREAKGSADAAVVVGIEDYAYVPKVPGATRNATDWSTFFRENMGLDEESVLLLRDRKATRDDILDAVRGAADKAKPGGTLWVVFIGHGAPAKGGDEGVLVDVNAQQSEQSLYKNSVRQSELLAAMGATKASHRVIMIDACFNGVASNGQALVPGLQPLIVASTAKGMGAGTTLLSAGKSDEFAGSLPGLGRPAFSYLLLGALRGWGDRDGDRKVTLNEAVSYARREIEKQVHDRSQTPQIAGAEPNLVVVAGATEAPPNLQGRGDLLLASATVVPLATADIKDNPCLGKVFACADKCKDESDAALCTFAAQLYEEGKGGVRPSMDWAGKLYDIGCREGSMTACAALAEAHMTGLGRERDLNAARSYADDACDAGVARGCRVLGDLYGRGEGVPKNFEVAAKAYSRACQGHDAAACGALGRAYHDGLGVPPDDARATSLFRLACDGRDWSSCEDLAVAYQNGFGVRVDAQRAAEVRRRACEEMEGEGCDLGRPLAIHGASPRHGPGGAWSTATGSYEACKNGAITACVSLASFYEAGAGVRRDGREAFRLFEQACEAGDAKGCFHLAYMVHHGIATVASSNQARGLYRKACRGGVREACAFSKD